MAFAQARSIRWVVFSRNTQVTNCRTKNEAQNLCSKDWMQVGRCVGDRITHMWDWTGRPLQFVSHGGDHGEWR